MIRFQAISASLGISGIDSFRIHSIVPSVILRAAFLLLLTTFATRAVPPRALAWNEEVAARKLALVSGASSFELKDLHPTKRTEPLPVKRSGTFVLRALDKPALPDGKPCDTPCAIPESMTHPLLVILPDESHPTGIRVLVVDDNPAGFRWGSHRFINTTPRDLIIRLDEQIVEIPEGWKPIDVALKGETRGIPVLIALAAQKEKPLYSAIWEHNPSVRTLCFLVPGTDARESPVAFKSIPEDKLVVEFEAKRFREAE